MALAFDVGDTTLYVSALLRGRNLRVSARPLAPVVLHLHVYEFSDEGLNLACPPEFKDFFMHLRHLGDPERVRNVITDILSHTLYNDLGTRWFWEVKLINYASNVGLLAFDAGVQELELNVEIHIYNLARWHEHVEEMEQVMDEVMRYYSDEEIGHGDSGASSEASIEEPEVVKYNGVGGEFEQNGCSICLEEFGLEMEVTRMPCKHIFHGGCLDRWLEKSHLCPYCRYEMPI